MEITPLEVFISGSKSSWKNIYPGESFQVSLITFFILEGDKIVPLLLLLFSISYVFMVRHMPRYLLFNFKTKTWSKFVILIRGYSIQRNIFLSYMRQNRIFPELSYLKTWAGSWDELKWKQNFVIISFRRWAELQKQIHLSANCLLGCDAVILGHMRE